MTDGHRAEIAAGVYLPLGTMAPLWLGGLVRAMVERGALPEGESDPGVLRGGRDRAGRVGDPSAGGRKELAR